jgi:hypothetical protein
MIRFIRTIIPARRNLMPPAMAISALNGPFPKDPARRVNAQVLSCGQLLPCSPAAS